MGLFQFLWTLLFVTSRFFLKYTRFTEWVFFFFFFFFIWLWVSFNFGNVTFFKFCGSMLNLLNWDL